jgi:hypothetical protein
MALIFQGGRMNIAVLYRYRTGIGCHPIREVWISSNHLVPVGFAKFLVAQSILPVLVVSTDHCWYWY